MRVKFNERGLLEGVDSNGNGLVKREWPLTGRDILDE